MSYKKNDIVILTNDNEVVIERKHKDTYLVYPVMQTSTDWRYRCYFKVTEEDIKGMSNLVFG